MVAWMQGALRCICFNPVEFGLKSPVITTILLQLLHVTLLGSLCGLYKQHHTKALQLGPAWVYILQVAYKEYYYECTCTPTPNCMRSIFSE